MLRPVVDGVRAIVPTVGASELLAECLAALRRDGGPGLEIVLVAMGPAAAAPTPEDADRVERVDANLGFAAGCNRALRDCRSHLVAIVNDDAVVEPGWLDGLRRALETEPAAAAAQGVNLALGRPGLADGLGLGWNRSWQAVQLGHHDRPPEIGAPVREIFGVSGTAALFRRSSLERVALPGGEIFDSRLFAYYEDVDLACRLRAAGYHALLVPSSRARHAGSLTGARHPGRRLRLLYRNRLLVLARLFGRGFWSRAPRILGRDLADLGGALGRGDLATAGGVLGGWGLAAGSLRRFARRGGPSLPVFELERFRSAG